jgi:transcriptional regulator GlxA family with amidase domain
VTAGIDLALALIEEDFGHALAMLAAHSLAQSRRPMKRIALDCGFGTEQNLRRAFVRRFGVPPLSYRERFAPLDAAAQG